MINEYLKNTLDTNCKRLYEQMVNVFRNGGESVDCGSSIPNEIAQAYMAVNADHPEFFFLSHMPEITQKIGLMGRRESVLVSKKIFSNRQIQEYNSEIENIKQRIITSANRASSVEEKEKIVCDYIIEHSIYEIDNKYNQNAATLLVEGKGQCSGIAKATKLLFDHLNIPCIVVNGDAEDKYNGIKGPHSWNIVKINNGYYHLDVTFMLGANLSKTKPYRYLYFNYSDNNVATDHAWDSKQYPSCPSEWTSSISSSTPTGGKTIGSLYELRELLKKELGKREPIDITSLIKVETPEELLRMVSSTVRSVTSQIGLNLKVSIQIIGNSIKLTVVG